MSNEIVSVVVLVVVGFITAVSQVMLKISANKPHRSPIKEYLNPWVIGSYGLLFLTTLLTMWSMQFLSFKLVSVLTCLSYIFVVIFGRVLLKETISPKKWLGMGMICLGIILFNAL